MELEELDDELLEELLELDELLGRLGVRGRRPALLRRRRHRRRCIRSEALPKAPRLPSGCAEHEDVNA